MQEENAFNRLPSYIIDSIFELLRGEELATSCSVCKSWNKIIIEDKRWQRLLERDWSHCFFRPEQTLVEFSRAEYRKRHLAVRQLESLGYTDLKDTNRVWRAHSDDVAWIYKMGRFWYWPAQRRAIPDQRVYIAQEGALSCAWDEWSAMPESEQLAFGVFLLSHLRDTSVEYSSIKAKIDGLVGTLQTESRIFQDPTISDTEKLQALNKFFVARFRGYDGDDYYSLDSNNIEAVLRQRRGQPIALSVLYIILARAVGLNVFGISFPGHFICAMREDGKTPLGGPDPANSVGLSQENARECLKSRVYIDVFKECRTLTFYELRADFQNWPAAVAVEDRDLLNVANSENMRQQYVYPASSLAIFMRMMSNIRNCWERQYQTSVQQLHDQVITREMFRKVGFFYTHQTELIKTQMTKVMLLSGYQNTPENQAALEHFRVNYIPVTQYRGCPHMANQ